jgi:hypothetical protein
MDTEIITDIPTEIITKINTEISIAREYAFAMHIVREMQGDKPDYLSDEEWIVHVSQLKNYLANVINKDYWTTEDLEPFRNAIK